MDNQLSDSGIILIGIATACAFMGLIFLPLWIEPFIELVKTIFRKIGTLRDELIWKIDDAKNARKNNIRKKQLMKNSKIIVSVESEPVQKTTSDGRILEFIKVKMKSGDVKELYKNVDFTYSWFWADDHSAASEDTPDVIRKLLDHYRIDHATTMK